MPKSLSLITLLTVFCLILAFGAPAQIIVDNDYGSPSYVETGTWTTSSSPGYNGGTYRFVLQGDPYSTATWMPTIATAGRYEVYAVFLLSNNRAPDAPYTINHADGSTTVRIPGFGSGVNWVYLGEFNFNAGTDSTIVLSNNGSSGAFIADAVALLPATDDPPVVDQLAHDPPYPQVSDTVTINARATDDLGIASVELNYSASPSGNSDTVVMFDDGAHGDGGASDGIYGGEIPPMPEGDTVLYDVTAEDTGENTNTSSSASYVVGEDVPREYRSLWADSWNASFLNESQTDDMVGTARTNNINTTMIEVRKIGDAYYDSNLEPRATNISSGTADFDPLGYMIDQAHDTSNDKEYVHVHAWFVMHRISKGETLDPQHVLSQHPEYIMTDRNGVIVSNNSIFLDPGHPGSVDHNVAVIVDCLQNYDIDGINLDYIRYPEGSGDWGYNPVSIARFNDVYGKTGQPSSSDPDWADWRRECVSLEVRKIHVKTRMVDPEVILTADTVNWGYSYNNFEASSAYAGVYQDWVDWLAEGILDYNALMNYSTSNSRFEGWTDLSLASDDKRGSIIGVGVYLQSSVQDGMDQLLYARDAGAAGLNIYDWGSEVNATSESRADFYSALRNQVFTEWVDPPVSPWIANPTTGTFEGNVTLDGVPVDHATIWVDGVSGSQTVTDGSGWYGLLDIPPGSQTIKVTYKSEPEKTVVASIPAAGDIVTVDIELNAPTIIQPDQWLVY